MDLSAAQLLSLSRKECSAARLLDWNCVFDSFVLKLPNANAAVQCKTWQTPWMEKATAFMKEIGGLFDINRPGIDRAALAGLDAAEAYRTGGPMSARSLQPTEEED
jgi:hypothetical protein